MLLDECTDGSMRLLAEMVSTPSLSSDEDKVATLLEDYIRELSPHVMERRGNNLIAHWRGERPGPTLLLCSHLDTVAPASGWTRNPFKATIEGEKLYGLGANDAGASVVSMIGAIKAATPLEAGQVILCIAAEEELGSNGFMAIEPLLPRYDAAIFGEPTNMGVATEMRGAMKLVMHSRGTACHASRPWEGKNAMDSFGSDLHKIRSLNLSDGSRWGRATIEPTTISGGKSSNQIPDLVTTTLDIRTTPTKSNDWILSELRALGIEFYVESNRRRPMTSPASHPLVKAIRRASTEYQEYAFNGTCDMAFATAPSVVMGPGRSERSHAADEFCTRTEVHEAITIYADVIREYMRRPE
jgi:acetylornithine deacetylase